MFDYSKLLGRLKEKGYTQGELAKLLGISENSLSNKVNGKSRIGFSSPEILKICEFLKIDKSDVFTYFFTVKTKKL